MRPERAHVCSTCHARALEGVNPFKTSDICVLPKVIFPSRQGCLEGEMTFGDPFEDSGVAGFPVLRDAVAPALRSGFRRSSEWE